MRRSLSRIATLCLILGALGVAVLAMRNQLRDAASVVSARQVERSDLLAMEGHLLGTSSATLRIVEFGDFQCPYCALVHNTLDSLLEPYSGEIALVYRHYPLRLTHEFAIAAAHAAECAAEQGRFFEMAKVFFQHQSKLGVEPWAAMARSAGVADTSAFRRCSEAERYGIRIERDRHVADSIEVIGVPTLIIGDRMLSGSISLPDLERNIAQALKSARRTKRQIPAKPE